MQVKKWLEMGWEAAGRDCPWAGLDFGLKATGTTCRSGGKESTQPSFRKTSQEAAAVAPEKVLIPIAHLLS